GVLDPGRTDLARTAGPGPDADHEHIRVPMQGEERLPEGLAQLILAGDPERLVLLYGVQSPFGGAVEPEQTVAVAGDHRYDRHGGEHERLVPQLRVVDREHVPVGRFPAQSGVLESASDVDVDHVLSVGAAHESKRTRFRLPRWGDSEARAA